jgi:hypothetical protein
MFHDDARVNMLAGFLEDGHNIKGKEHLVNALLSWVVRVVTTRKKVR